MAGPLLPTLLLLLLSLAPGSAGQAAQDTGERIINGVVCAKGTHPWQVALYYNNVFQCAGVLINKRWVLTVAHCRRSEFIVQMGSDLLVDPNAQKIRATETYVHPRYDIKTDVHNIMLVKLSSPAKLSSTVMTISVPSSCRLPRKSCTVSGWGSVTMDVAVGNPLALMCSKVSLISYKDCRQDYPTVLKKFTICAAPLDRKSFACRGDAGSPLICQGILQGLVSSDYFPCRPPFDPIIYIHVCKYSKWIFETMINSC